MKYEAKFGFRFSASQLPESGDIRVDLPKQDLDELRRENEEIFESRLGEAMREPWDKLHKLIADTSKKLTDADNEEDQNKRRYHDTLITNAQSLCGLLTHLNITKDPKLEQARRDLELTMLGADIDVIKESPEVRKSLKTKLDAILGQYDW
jgi:hypothetical protein